MIAPRRLTIFEGPDGSGKTTAAQNYAAITGAHYVHCGPFPGMVKGLGRFYVDAMMPAVYGHVDVVMDRCWLSEAPYGAAFRGGVDRLGAETCRIIERLAMRCGTVVCLALPPKVTTTENFLRRKGKEYLQRVEQLHQVYEWYQSMTTALPVCRFDYTTVDMAAFWDSLHAKRTKAHRLQAPSAGNLRAEVLLVGDAYGYQHDFDALYQWPFGGLGGGGCSRWFARQLELGEIDEQDLVWLNADAPEWAIRDLAKGRRHIIALGNEADDKLRDLDIRHEHCEHPQYWKRFHAGKDYSLVTRLQEICHEQASL